jgi:uncharacterized radical SAM protein YgiQ
MSACLFLQRAKPHPNMNSPLNIPSYDVSVFPRDAKPLTRYRKYWAARFGPAKFLPMNRAEMDELGWDSCDIIIVSGDAYVDHPSFGMAVIGRVLEAQGFRVGVIAQPDWTGDGEHRTNAFKALGRPNLFFGVTAGNMDSMINRYTAERRMRTDDAYTPGGMGGSRPDHAAVVYSQRCREAYADVPIVLGGIEGSLRRIAHYDYWQDKVRASIVIDSGCDILLYGNAERAIVEVAHRLATDEPVTAMTDIRGTAFIRRDHGAGWYEIDSTSVDEPGRETSHLDGHVNPYLNVAESVAAGGVGADAACMNEDSAPPTGVETKPLTFMPRPDSATANRKPALPPRERSVIRLPSFDQVRDPVLYAHANRVLHLETNPGNARALVQAHRSKGGRDEGSVDVWINPPPIPLATAEMDHVFDLPYARSPHPSYADENGSHDGYTKIPAWEMIRFSVNIMRGCFGGCTFCSITEHEGRVIQSRSQNSILREIEAIRDTVPGFTGVISDLGGPTANMYRIGCKSPEIEAVCRKPSCVYPGICSNLNTNHSALIQLYRDARALPGIKKILIGSGLRYDLANESPEYVKELVTHHVGGYLKIAPEHTETGPLTKMMKPGVGSYDKFKDMFDRFSLEAGKKQFLVPYFIAAHPGTSDEDMMHLAVWLKQHSFRADQVQTFYPSPMATATAMYHTQRNPLRKITRKSEKVDVVRDEPRRRLHKAFLQYHRAENWPLLREALTRMGRADLIGNGKMQLIPAWQPAATNKNTRAPSIKDAARAAPRPGRALTQHTGLPPRAGTGAKVGIQSRAATSSASKSSKKR